MKFAVLGTGNVGRTLAGKLVALGHEVTMGSRSADNAEAVAWAAQAGPSAAVATLADASAAGAVILNATMGLASLQALEAAGAANLDGKILIDVANALDFSNGFPPSLGVVNTDSLGEQIQRAYPGARVVKTFNTMPAALMVEPSLVPGHHSVFLSGNDAGAKAEVAGLLGTFGWPAEDILDLGDITTARGVEMYMPLWLRLFGAVGAPIFNIAIARG